MASPKLYCDQEVGAGEYVRIWQSDSGNLFEHVFPTGRSISVLCGSLDDAQKLMAGSVNEGLEADFQFLPSDRLFDGEGRGHERF